MRIRKLDIVITPVFLIVLPLLLMAGYLHQYLMMFFSITIHEAGHIIAAMILNSRIKKIIILPMGLVAKLDISPWPYYSRYIIIVLFGPLINIFVGTLLFFTNKVFFLYFDEQVLHFFIISNLSLGVFNLLPVIPLDGGNILKALLQKRYGNTMASTIIFRITIVVAIALFALGIVQTFKNPINISFAAVGIAVVFYIKKEMESLCMTNLKQLLYKKERLLKKGVYSVRYITALEETTVKQLLKSMDYDAFHMIHIVDEQLRVQKTISEQMVVSWIIENGLEGNINSIE